MARPAKWNSKTTSIRVPEHCVEQLLALAQALDQIPETEPEPAFADYVNFVRNAAHPCLLTVQDGAKTTQYRCEYDPRITPEEFVTIDRLAEDTFRAARSAGMDPMLLLAELAAAIYTPLPRRGQA